MNKILLFILAIAAFSSCNLENEIDLNLPEFEPQLVVECYLEPGKPYRANVSMTSSYYAPASDLLSSIVQNATVIITYQGVPDTLKSGIYLDGSNFYVYGSSTIVPADYTSDFFLEVIDTAGNRLTATTKIAPPIQLDSIQVEPLQIDTSVIILTFSQDNPTIKNFYRRMQYRTSAISDSLKSDFIVSDEIISNGQIVLGGPPVFVEGDTMVIQFMEITEAFYDYIDSRERLESANGNPFGQPGVIKTNIVGGIGIFTGFTPSLQTYYLQ
ncbi:MAG: DUF4249 domain-containing protein [Saprospiraceae bacterium]|nr:DUF4249 domain-containing protein [Saprospiraceae bacterium]